jgi:hypothetical protein
MENSNVQASLCHRRSGAAFARHWQRRSKCCRDRDLARLQNVAEMGFLSSSHGRDPGIVKPKTLQPRLIPGLCGTRDWVNTSRAFYSSDHETFKKSGQWLHICTARPQCRPRGRRGNNTEASHQLLGVSRTEAEPIVRNCPTRIGSSAN